MNLTPCVICGWKDRGGQASSDTEGLCYCCAWWVKLDHGVPVPRGNWLIVGQLAWEPCDPFSYDRFCYFDRTFVFSLDDGTIISTRSVRCRGPVPMRFQFMFPSNAVLTVIPDYEEPTTNQRYQENPDVPECSPGTREPSEAGRSKVRLQQKLDFG